MAKLTLNGRELEIPEGAQLVEVIKNQGTFISNLCYVDGLPPYAGCRTCLVEIEGARGLQLSCTTKVADGMIVNTNTPEARATRQAVLSLILSYHSDRCLTCHRVVKCKPGDTCLRDGVVTHRCLTCSKNYRCELQTTCEMLEMAGYEPWDGEDRTYYVQEQPQPDQANPFLEFDPQMCIICTRCVRACDEIRHTGAITLAGRGYSTRIAFGSDGPVHDSNCDFCGACIDVCPTATLMEHPNKWGATQTERWTNTTCTQCSVGCTISLGTKKGRGVIVRPDQFANPVSRDQVCVRGRFGYDAVKPSHRLAQPMIKRNGGQDASTWDEAMEFTAARIAQVREEHGPASIGFLGSPFATNEENYLLGKIARAIVGTNNVDSSVGPVARAVAESLRERFGSEVLPADMLRIAKSKTILAVGEDLESSHNVAALRIKDAVVRNEAKLIVISPFRGEVCDFADVFVQCDPGAEATVLAALDAALAGEQPTIPAAIQPVMEEAGALLLAAKQDGKPLSIVYGVGHLDPARASAITAALANLAITLAGEEAKQALFILPQEANIWGLRDTGGSPDLLPSYRSASDEDDRKDLERLWGAPVPADVGLGFEDIAKLKALVVFNDNPMMLAPDRAAIEKSLKGLDFLAVVDGLHTDTAKLAHAVMPDTGAWAKDGTTVSADRRILRMQQAVDSIGEARQGWRILAELGARLAERLNPGEIRINYATSAEIMDEMTQVIPLYKDAAYATLDSGTQQFLGSVQPQTAERQAMTVSAPSLNGGFHLFASRSLFMSYEAASVHAENADKLHRDDSVRINPADAAALKIAEGDIVVLKRNGAELRLPARITSAVAPKALHLPIYHDAGAVLALFDSDIAVTTVELSRA